jgi:hypothetical protein
MIFIVVFSFDPFTYSTFIFRFELWLITIFLNLVALGIQISKTHWNFFSTLVGREDIFECFLRYSFAFKKNSFRFFWQECEVHKVDKNLQRVLLWKANKLLPWRPQRFYAFWWHLCNISLLGFMVYLLEIVVF